MEAFTGGRVSPAARRAYLDTNPHFSADNFTATRGGYVMHAWESQIAMARAMGRGVHSGRNKPAHRFDKKS